MGSLTVGGALCVSDELRILELCCDRIPGAIGSIPSYFPSGRWFDSFCSSPRGFLTRSLFQKLKQLTLHGTVLPFDSISSKCNLVAPGLCWEAELVKDCHPNGEIEWLQQLYYMLGEDVTRLRRSFKETRVFVLGEDFLACFIVGALLHMRKPLTSFWRESQLEKSSNGDHNRTLKSAN